MTNNEKGQNSMDHHCRVNKPEGGRKKSQMHSSPFPYY